MKHHEPTRWHLIATKGEIKKAENFFDEIQPAFIVKAVQSVELEGTCAYLSNKKKLDSHIIKDENLMRKT